MSMTKNYIFCLRKREKEESLECGFELPQTVRTA